MHTSASLMTDDSVQNCYYKEVHVNFEPVQAQAVDHMLPLLEGPLAEGGDTLNASTQRIADEMRGNGASVGTFSVKWRSRTAGEVRQQLMPMITHYKIQRLLVQERTRRLAIEVGRFTFQHNLMSAFNYTASLSQRLCMYSAQLKLQGSERLLFNSHNFNRFSLSLPSTLRWSEAPNGEGREDLYDPFSRRSAISAKEETHTRSTSFPSRSGSFSPSLSPVRYDKTLCEEWENRCQH